LIDLREIRLVPRKD